MERPDRRTAVRIAAAVLLVASGLAAVGSVPLVFVSLFSFDAPDAMAQLSAWAMFVTLMACLPRSLGAAAVAIGTMVAGSARGLAVTLVLLLVPAGTLLYMTTGLRAVVAPPACTAAAGAHGAAVIRDTRCP